VSKLQRVLKLETKFEEIANEELDNIRHAFETLLNDKIKKLPNLQISENESSVFLDVRNGILKIGIKEYKELKKRENPIEKLEHKLFGNEDATNLHFEVKRKLADSLFCYQYYEKHKDHLVGMQEPESLLYEKLVANTAKLFSKIYAGNGEDYKETENELYQVSLRNAELSEAVKQHIQNNTFWEYYLDKYADWEPYTDPLANEMSLILLGELLKNKKEVREVIRTVYNSTPEEVLQSIVKKDKD